MHSGTLVRVDPAHWGETLETVRSIQDRGNVIALGRSMYETSVTLQKGMFMRPMGSPRLSAAAEAMGAPLGGRWPTMVTDGTLDFDRLVAWAILDRREFAAESSGYDLTDPEIRRMQRLVERAESRQYSPGCDLLSAVDRLEYMAYSPRYSIEVTFEAVQGFILDKPRLHSMRDFCPRCAGRDSETFYASHVGDCVVPDELRALIE